MPSEFKYNKEADVREIISEAIGIMTHELIALKLHTSPEKLFVQMKTSKIDPFS